MKALITSALALLLAAPLTARAELVITDWQTAGDQALMWDTVSNREWLRLHYTAGLSYHQVGAQLGADGDYRGFSRASVSDVWQLFDNAGLTPRYPAPDDIAKLFIGQWGLDSWDEASGYSSVRAITADWQPEVAVLIAAGAANIATMDAGSGQLFVAMVGYGALDPNRPSFANATGTSIGADTARADTGSALWRLRAQDAPATPLPLPGSLSLAALGLLVAASSGRRRSPR
jgi:hypothetical protein